MKGFGAWFWTGFAVGLMVGTLGIIAILTVVTA